MSGETCRFTIVTPVYNTPLDVLGDTIDSVLAQTFESWEFVLVDDCSPDPAVREAVRAAASKDARITVIERAANGGISAASNDGLAAAHGEFIALLDHDDLLTEDALQVMSDAIDANPEGDYFYSDEDKVTSDGELVDPFLKPIWSPERLRGQMYTGHLSVLRTSLVRDVGGFDTDFDGSQDHDLVLKVTERARSVVHVPEVLYHWRILPGSAAVAVDEKPYAWEAGRNAVQAHLDRSGILGRADFGPVPGTYVIHRPLPADVRVSIVIPTRGSVGLVWGEERCFVLEAVRSAMAMTDHTNIEFVIVYDDATPEAVLTQLREMVAPENLVLTRYSSPFNFSKKCNYGVIDSSGDVIVLLNDDTEVKSHGWLEALVAPVLDRTVGLTGALLLFSDSTIQHAGHIYSDAGYHHLHYGVDITSYGNFADLLIARECSGVTAACAAIRREVFDEIGGLTEALPGNFNDVDFCMKIGSLGYRILWTPSAELYHFESKTRDSTVTVHDMQVIRGRWGISEPHSDPYVPSF
jgi:glycosyltransferase involved in cell wall biosynthesis